MKGDFSRDTFEPTKHYVRVLMQQGRVQLDADWNEQVAIVVHHLRCLAEDVFGEAGGPRGRAAFAITPRRESADQPADFDPREVADLDIAPGRYYVGGVLCENASPTTYRQQSDFPRTDADAGALKEPPYLVYLDVWERYISALEDEAMREVALGGPDTTGRSRTVWQVKVAVLETADVTTTEPPALAPGVWQRLLEGDPTSGTPGWQPTHRGLLRARASVPSGGSTDPCTVAPDSRYRGPENQLYRVEIHQGGTAQTGATFKWSRENGSVAFPLLHGERMVGGPAGVTVGLATHGRDAKLGLEEGDWVEIVEDARSLLGAGPDPRVPVEPLVRVQEIDRDAGLVTLSTGGAVPGAAGHPFLRRWDQRERTDGTGTLAGGAVLISERRWIELEDGVQIRFDEGQTYRSGDYWLIAARTATGDVEWPQDGVGDHTPLPPRGVDHRYAPLAILSTRPDGKLRVTDLRAVGGPGG